MDWCHVIKWTKMWKAYQNFEKDVKNVAQAEISMIILLSVEQIAILNLFHEQIIWWIVNSSVGKCGVSWSIMSYLSFIRNWCSLSLLCFKQCLQLSLWNSKVRISVATTSFWLLFLIMSIFLLQLSHIYLGWIAVTSFSISKLKRLAISVLELCFTFLFSYL